MRHFEQLPGAPGKGDGGRAEAHFSHSLKLNREGEGINKEEGGNRASARPPSPFPEEARAAFERELVRIMAANPTLSRTSCAFFVLERMRGGAKGITQRQRLRYLATSRPAMSLSRADRQAAARDPGLEWDDQTRTYRLRRTSTPAPSSPTDEPSEWGRGRLKVRNRPSSRPALATGKNANT